jgi:arylsulfatase
MYFFNFVPESFEENLRRIDDLGTPRAHNHYPWGWAWAGNTPFKRWKRETHEGGVADPLIVHWPNGIRALGETRHQYVHAIDLLPTLLDMTGIEAPTEIGGVTQTPFDGVSFAHTFDAPDAPSRRVTQYYEMLGCRAMYHEGWKAVVFHPMPTATYDGDPDRSFEEDAWELYHVAEDPCETVDLAVERPDKLAELVDLWWEEAARNKALPVTNLPGRHLDRRHRRERYELHPGIGSMPEAVAPNLRNRGWRMLVTVDAGESADSIAKSIDGVVMAHGSAAGGYAIYVKDRRLSYVHNRLGAELTTVTADVEIPDGETILRVEFTSTGPHEGNVDLFYGDLPVAEGHITAMTPITYGMAGFTVGHQRGSPITPAYEPPFAFSDGALGVVVVEAEGRAPRNPQAEQRAGQAMQ